MEESGGVILKFGLIIRINFTFPPFLVAQILATLCVCFTAVSFGANHAITSAIVFAFQKGTDDQMEMSMEEASWLRKNKKTLRKMHLVERLCGRDHTYQMVVTGYQESGGFP